MKKGILKLSVLFTALFIGVVGAHAISIPEAQNCLITNTGTEANAECNMFFTIAANETVKTGDEISITLHSPSHIQGNAVTVEMESDWVVVNDTETAIGANADLSNIVKLKVRYVGTADLTDTTVKFAVGKYTKDDAYAEQCGYKYGLQANVCSANADSAGTIHYFDSKGEYLGYSEEAKAAYYKDCFVCQSASEASDGKWHGSTGVIVTEDEYYAQCLSCLTPDNSPDKKYHGLNGRETDEAGYKNECTKTCKTPDESGDGKYYCKDGNECTEAEYKEQCIENPKSGSFIPYVGIAAGIILIGTSTIMVRKQSKLRKL